MAILKCSEIKKRATGETSDRRITIKPEPDYDKLIKNGSAAIDLRLGRWLTTLRNDAVSVLDFAQDESSMRNRPEQIITKRHFVPFGGEFILQPQGFVLGVTLEWIKLPDDIAGYVTARSRIGRRGLIIATAAGVHPNFSGCLTLELSNVNEVPISLRPGLSICQLFLHKAEGERISTISAFSGSRVPFLGPLENDRVTAALFHQ